MITQVDTLTAEKASVDGNMSDLGSLGGNSTALGINNAGEIVGIASNSAFIVNPLSAPVNAPEP